MKKTQAVLGVLALASLTVAPFVSERASAVSSSAGDLTPTARRAILDMGNDLAKLEESHRKLSKTGAEKDDLYIRLEKSTREVARLAEKLERDRAQRQMQLIGRDLDELLAAVEEMQELQQSQNRQYYWLQQKTQDESRRYQSLSNTLKARHDTARNAINNLR